MFSDAEGNASTLLNRAGIVELPLLSTLLAIYQKSREPSLWEVMNSFLISIGKFGSFKNPFAVITSLSELYFRFRRFILLVQMKKLISINYGSSTSCWKPWRWVRLDLILSMRDINSKLNSPTKFTSSSRSTEFKDILPCIISQIIKNTLWIWWKVNKNWDSNMVRISQLRESHCRTNTSIIRKK